MYKVVICNNNEETIIHYPTSDKEAPHILEGKIKKQINQVDFFEFTMPINNSGYNKIIEMQTLIKVINTKDNNIVFEGRIILAPEKMDTEGKFVKLITAEGELGYLNDTHTRKWEDHNITVYNYLKKLIDNHNAHTTEDKHFTIGLVEVEDNLYRITDYNTTLFTLADKLVNRCSGEIRVRKENNIRYIDYVSKVGHTNSTEIMLGVNMKDMELEKDPTGIITRLIPLGKDGLTIESVNGGKDYIDNTAAISNVGVIEGTYTWEDVTLPQNLLKKAREKLDNELTKITRKLAISALELSTINLNIESFSLGDNVKIINPIMGVNEYFRIIEQEIDIINPQNSTLIFDNKYDTLTDRHIDMQVTARKIDNIIVEGGVSTGYLQGTINLLRNNMRAMADTAEKQEAKAILFEDRVPGSPTYGAMALGTKGFMIANVFADGEWQWRTFGTGRGFVADCIVAGRILGNNAEFNLNEGYLKITHRDGTYSKMDINGFQHYIAGRPYPYLGLVTASSEILVNTQQQGSGGATGNYGITKVQLPSEFRGKSPKIMVNYQRINAVSMGMGDVLIPGVSWQNYNSTNATFDIIGYLYHTDRDGNIKYGGGIVASYMAVV